MRDELGYIEVLQQRAGGLNVKRLLLIKENQISPVKEFSAFLPMGRCKSLGSLISFLLYTPLLSGASVFTSWASLRLTVGTGCSLMAARWQMFFSFLCSLRAHWLILEGSNCWWWWHPCLLIWQKIFYFSREKPEPRSPQERAWSLFWRAEPPNEFMKKIDQIYSRESSFCRMECGCRWDMPLLLLLSHFSRVRLCATP